MNTPTLRSIAAVLVLLSFSGYNAVRGITKGLKSIGKYGPVDAVTLLERNLKPVRIELQAERIVGYIDESEGTDGHLSKRYVETQYVLAPLVVAHAVGPNIVLAYDQGQSDPREVREGYTLLKDLPNGYRLYQKQDTSR